MSEQVKSQSQGGESLGKKIGKGLWDILTTERKVPAKEAPKNASPTSVEKPVQSTQEVDPKSGIVDDSLVGKLWAIIEENNLDGFDFVEFNRILNSSTTIRETDKYTDTFKTLKALDAKNADLKGTLISSAKHYLSILQKEKEDFERDFQGIVDERVGSKKKEHDQLSSEVAELERQRVQLEQQVKEKQVKMASLEDEISKHDIELQRQRKNFLATMKSILSEIEEKTNKIDLFIKDEKKAEAAQ